MMAPERIANLMASRDRLAMQLGELRSLKPKEDGTKKAARAIKDWAFDCEGLEKLIVKLDATIAPATPRKVKEKAARPLNDAASEGVKGTPIARIAKGKRAEMRVSVNEWKGQHIVDVRLWFIPKAGGDWAPSRKGVSVEAGKLDALVQALILAKQHMVAPL